MSLQLLSARHQRRRIPLWDERTRPSDPRANRCTIILGRNGAGKSRLLASIARAFAAADTGGFVQPELFGGRGTERWPQLELEYVLSEHPVYLSATSKQLDVQRSDGTIVRNPRSLMPARVIASTLSPSDKLPLGLPRSDLRSSSTPRSAPVRPVRYADRLYRYLGAKSGSAIGGGSRLQLNRIVAALVASLSRAGQHRTRLEHVFGLLRYQPRLLIEFKVRGVSSTLRAIAESAGDLSSLTEAFARESRSYGPTIVYPPALIEAGPAYALRLAEAAAALLQRHTPGGIARVEVDFARGTFVSGSSDLLEEITLLSDVGVVGVSNVSLFSDGGDARQVRVVDASSGEQAVTITMLGVASEIDDSSLVLLDEPEIGLHPEWQERFLPLLRDTFEAYSGCHFVLATHSPQIVSHANEMPVTVVGMDEMNLVSGEVVARKSADFQLATVFDVPGFRNEYLAREALAAYQMTAERRTTGAEYRDLIRLLVQVRPKLASDDPVAHLIDAVLHARTLA